MLYHSQGNFLMTVSPRVECRLAQKIIGPSRPCDSASSDEDMRECNPSGVMPAGAGAIELSAWLNCTILPSYRERKQ